MNENPAAIVILGQGSLETAWSMQAVLPGSSIYGLSGRVDGADIAYDEFGATVRDLYLRDTPLVVMCATGIIIRSLAPLLQNKRVEPPVVVVAEDGSAVVPLLGGLRGVNTMARRIGEALAVKPAITTTGEVRFNLALENPPAGYVLRNPAAGKKFMSDMLAGEGVRIDGPAPWLAESRIPRDPNGRLSICVTPQDREPAQDELIFHPKTVVIALAGGEGTTDLAAQMSQALADAGLAKASVALLLAGEDDAADGEIHAAAAALGCPLRLVSGENTPDRLVGMSVANPINHLKINDNISISVAASPESVRWLGRKRGRLAVIGLGPGSTDLMAPAVREELRRTQDIIGYETYVTMAGPFRPDQTIHASDNRVEMDRARHAFTLAAQGRDVTVVSSGDPGVFAMATAVVEALHDSTDPAWHGVELVVLPGISAAQAAASRAGAPLGHDFCIISLSDNLKPWPVILNRLDHAAAADLVMAFYNPISKARPWQLGEALDMVRKHRAPETPVVLGRDIGRPAERLRVTTLGQVTPDQVDMRTVVIIGSSLTRTFPKADGGVWVYTPRWYGEKPDK